jgi:N-methylhydantoinase A/oxoprolinase/acetone carboxylase beta subunit
MNRIGIDVGGTFTDVVLVDDASGGIWSTKVPTMVFEKYSRSAAVPAKT